MSPKSCVASFCAPQCSGPLQVCFYLMFVWSTVCGQLKLLLFLNGYLWLLTLSRYRDVQKRDETEQSLVGKVEKKKWVKLSAVKSERKYSGIVKRQSIWRESRESWRKGGGRQKEKGNGISAEKKKQSLDDKRKQWISKRKKVNAIKRKKRIWQN